MSKLGGAHGFRGSRSGLSRRRAPGGHRHRCQCDRVPGDQRDRQDEVPREAERFLARRRVTARVVGAIGDPAFEILRIAEETDADMIVVGRCRSHTLQLLGSLSMKLVRSVTCDVLVVHAADRGGAPP